MGMIINPYRFAGATTIDGTLGSTDAGILAAVLFTTSGGTVTIVGQTNVSGVTRLAQGLYRITFSSALANTNYGMLLGARQIPTGDNRSVLVQPNRDSSSSQNTYSTTTVDIRLQAAGNAAVDPSHCMAVVYDPQAISGSNYLAAASWTLSGTTLTLQRQTNVSSMSRHAAGVYRVNFNSALADVDYAEWPMSRYPDFSGVAQPIAGQNRNTTIPSNLHTVNSLDLYTGELNQNPSGQFDAGRGSVLVGNADVAPRGTIARVRFSVSGAVATIIDSYNVSSVSTNATGMYRVNFTLPCVDTNYGVVASGKWANFTNDDVPIVGAQANSGGFNKYAVDGVDIVLNSFASVHFVPDFVNVWVVKPWLM